ncbi:hypothetical protein [Winogradskyella bathintestinalis]|uniref:Outer membrane protein beta-barrel domain-containing protein n=1 Tax=Winogradskyella bathintestinalis TaxID=3035208 RepID=A0ABT7ZRK7_9FLAO|nr:hypothetical protein [Winogradskyella bathintestinalis]MDN3491640.1 hypothetical protein [Winogradskyella bathintestinalis]
MNDKKNIDRLFQEKFKDFEVTPNDTVWENISESLPNKKKKRKVIGLWWQLGGVAAVIALLLTVGFTIFNSNKSNTQEFPIVNTDKTDSASENDSNNYLKDNKQIELNTADSDSSKVADSNSDIEDNSYSNISENNSSQTTSTSNQLTNSNTISKPLNRVANNTNVEDNGNDLSTPTSKDKNGKIATQSKISNSNLKNDNKSIVEKNDKSFLNTDIERKSTIKTAIEQHKNAIADNLSTQNQNSKTLEKDSNKEDSLEKENSLLEASEQATIENAIAENEDTTDDGEKDNKRNRWSISPNIAPVYFSSMGEGSSIDQQFNNNSKSSDVNMSYGIAGSYAISKKLKVRAGINRINLNQTTTDVFAFTGAATTARGVGAQYKNIAFNNGKEHTSLMSSTMMNKSSTPELFNTKFPGEIEQKFGFIEIPVALEYALLDKKFGINIIGGFSTFILNGNEIYADVNGTTTLIGEASNINNTSFSANFGLGMDYNLSKQWDINLEPTFKYQLNTFDNTTGNFRPFIIGVYTGLSFKF